MHTANRHLCGNGEAQRRTKGSFGKTMMQALELLQLAKGTSPDRVTLKSEEIKPVAIAIMELRLLSVSQSVENSVK